MSDSKQATVPTLSDGASAELERDNVLSGLFGGIDPTGDPDDNGNDDEEPEENRTSSRVAYDSLLSATEYALKTVESSFAIVQVARRNADLNVVHEGLRKASILLSTARSKAHAVRTRVNFDSKLSAPTDIELEFVFSLVEGLQRHVQTTDGPLRRLKSLSDEEANSSEIYVTNRAYDLQCAVPDKKMYIFVTRHLTDIAFINWTGARVSVGRECYTWTNQGYHIVAYLTTESSTLLPLVGSTEETRQERLLCSDGQPKGTVVRRCSKPKAEGAEESVQGDDGPTVKEIEAALNASVKAMHKCERYDKWYKRTVAGMPSDGIDAVLAWRLHYWWSSVSGKPSTPDKFFQKAIGLKMAQQIYDHMHAYSATSDQCHKLESIVKTLTAVNLDGDYADEIARDVQEAEKGQRRLDNLGCDK